MITAEPATAQSFPVFPPMRAATPLPGTHVYLFQNSRLGFGAFVTAQQPGLPPGNFQNALGMPAELRQTRVGSRSTSKERDAETGLDYFGARYMSSAQGRFTSPDRYNAMLINQNMQAAGLPAAAAASFFNGYLENPQNWNQYAYVRNNPLRFTDPTGAAPAEGHHLITGRQILTSPLAQDFTNAIKSGPLSGNGAPNQPGFNAMHRAYNAAVEEVLSTAEQTAGDRNEWSLKQWKDAANQILNSEEPAIQNFLDELEENNPGAKAAIGSAITAYRVSASVAARMIAADLASDLMLFLRMPMIIMVDPTVTNPQKRVQEEIKKSHANCLIDRSTGQCIY